MSKKNVVLFCGVLLVLCAEPSAQVRTPDQMLISPDPKDWLTWNGSYNSQRYSQLKQVTTANASRLQAKWVYHHDGADEGEVTPIVANGVMYISGFNRVDALDARTGNVIWKYQRQPPSMTRQRGTAIYGDKVYVVTSDSHLVALDARTGGVRWEAKSEGGYTLAGGAPLVADGKVIVSGNRPGGFIQAFDAQTGKHLWHWTSLPKPGDPAYKTWGGATPAGAPIWISGSYDPDLGLLYYVLDRTNGQFLLGTPFIDKLDWATGLSPEGRPILSPGHEPSVKGTATCPSTAGATNWPPPTYSPDTRYFYVVVHEGCGINTITSSTDPNAPTGYYETPTDPWQAYVRAIDAFTGKRVWEYKAVRSNHYGPGLLSTAGGIVFAPEQFGQATILDAKTGQPLWHFNTGDVITAAPVTYSVDGQQFFAIMSGTNVFAFGLSDSR